MPHVLVNLLQTTGTKGGIEIYARELYKAIARESHEFTFTAFASHELAQTDTTWFPGEVIDSGISGENRLAWARGELFAVSRVAKELGVDLIHGPAMFGPKKTDIPVVLSIHDLLYFTHPELMQSKLFTEPVKLMEKWAIKNATRVITISEVSSRAIQKYLKYPGAKIDVIPLAGRSSMAKFASKQKRRSDLFLALGQRSPYKNFETVVNAWALIPEEHRPQLVITGSHGADPLRPLVDKLDLHQWVTLKEWVTEEELSELFGTATAVIDSTLASGSSMPSLEAMSIGLPVVMADSEVFQEVGAEAAEYFTKGDPESLARVVTALAANSKRQQELSRLGLTRAAKFSWQRIADETLETFRHALRDAAKG